MSEDKENTVLLNIVYYEILETSCAMLTEEKALLTLKVFLTTNIMISLNHISG